MDNFGICLLAYGDEHINEFNDLILTHPHIFVLTDDKAKIHNQSINFIETVEDFNFNLKRHVIAEAFKQYETVVLLDTDVKVTPQSFSNIDKLVSDGMYVKWIDNQLTHKNERLNMRNNEYCIELSKLNNNKLPIQFIRSTVWS